MSDLSRSDHVAHLVDDYLHDLLEPAQARAVAAHLGKCPACRTALARAEGRVSLLRALPLSEPSSDLPQMTMRRVADHERRRRRLRRWFVGGATGSIAVAALALLGINLYYLNLRPSPTNLVLLGQSELLANTAASLRLRLVNHRSGQPLAGVPVVVSLIAAGGQSHELARFETDSRGNGSPRVQVPDWADGHYQLEVRAATPTGEEVLRRQVRLKRSWKVLLTSDRPIYQPGQTVLLRCLALRRPDLKPVGGQAVEFTLTDPRGNVIFKQAGRASPFGISSAECPLAVEVHEGNYVVGCKVGDSDSRLPIEVRRYVLPRFAVKVGTDRSFYSPGEKGVLTVQADYFHGQPVSGAEVEVALSGLEIGEGKPATWTGKLDAGGKATAPFTVPPLMAGRPSDGGDARIRLTATVRAEETNARSVERPVTTRPVRVAALPEGGALVRGAQNSVYLLVTRADGTPVVGADVEVKGDAQAQVTTRPGGVATFPVTPTGSTVSWTIEVKGPKGELLARRQDTLQCGAATGDFLLRLDRPVYQAGQSMRLTAVGGGAEPVFIDLVKDGQGLRGETIEMGEGSGELTIDLPAELAGTLELLAYRFTTGGALVRKSRVVYVAPPDGLKVQVQGLAEKYRPGGDAELHFTLTDAQGRPAPGAISLSAVDEAVFATLAQRPGLEATFYHLEAELLKPVQAIFPWRPDESRPVARDRALFAATSRTVSAGPSLTGGAHSLGAASYAEKAYRADAVKRARLHLVRLGWMSLALAALLFIYALIWIYLPFADVLKVHGVAAIVLALLGLAGAGLLWFDAPSSLEKMAAGRGERDPAAKGAPPDAHGGDGPEGPRVRQHFPETLLWRPELITDDQGRLPPVKFRVADSITTWRLSATAVSADGRLGALQGELRARQDFFVEPTLPARLTRGDEVGVPVTVYNYLDKGQSVRLSFASSDGLKGLGPADVTVEVPAGERRTVRFDLRAETVGTHRLRITARGETVSDAVERPLEVEPDGRRVEVSHSGTLDAPASVTLDLPGDAVEGSALAQVKLYPSTFSQVVEGLDSLLRLPTGCFEQTSSAAYPNVLVLDYLKRTGRASRDVEVKARRYVHLGYQRLLSFEVPDGGFDWYGRPPGSRTLSAYGLMQFEDMARVHDVDADLIRRTRRWLLSQRERDGSWAPEDRLAGGASGEERRLATTAYIAWAVFARGDASDQVGPTREYLLQRVGEVESPYLLALCCNALLALGEDGVEQHLNRLAGMSRKEKGDRASWRLGERARTLFYGSGLAGDVETTALAALALVQGGQHAAKARGALGWLVGQKAPDGTWHSTQATVLALRALLAGTGRPLGADKERVFEVRVGAHTELRRVPADQAEVMLSLNVTPHLGRGKTAVRVTEKSPSGAGYQVVLRYHVPEDKAPTPRRGLSVELSYDRTELAVGQKVTVQATVTNHASATAPMVLLDLPLPPGFALDGDHLDRLAKSGTIGRYQAQASSVLVYLRQLPADKPLQLTYALRATLPVRATSRGARVYEYYDPHKQGISPAVALRVKPAE